MSNQVTDNHNMSGDNPDQQPRNQRVLEGSAEQAASRQRSQYPVDYDDPAQARNTDAPEVYGNGADRQQAAMRRAQSMAPNQRQRDTSSNRSFTFMTPDSGHGEGPPKKVHLIEPDPDVMDVCFEMAGEHEKRGDGVFMYQAQLNQIRMCLKQFGDDYLTFEQLQGQGLNQHVTTYEMQYVMKGLERLTSPPDAKVKRFLDSMQLVPAGQ